MRKLLDATRRTGEAASSSSADETSFAVPPLLSYSDVMTLVAPIDSVYYNVVHNEFGHSTNELRTYPERSEEQADMETPSNTIVELLMVKAYGC